VAFPTIPTVAASRVLVANQLDTSSTRTFPSLSSLTKNSGDLLIAIVVCYQSSTTSNIFSSWGASFNEFHDSGGTNEMCVGMAYKWSTGSETGTFTVTQAATVTGDASLILLSIPGAHASTPPEAGSRAVGTGAAADPASFDPSGWAAEDTLWISVVGSGMTSGTGSWTATGTTAPSNYTDRVDTNASDTSTIGDCEAAVSFRQVNASSEDVGTAGVDTSNARNVAVVVAVRPVPAVPFSADLTAPAFGVTPQGVTRLNDYVSALSVATVGLTANSLTRLNDWIGGLTAPSFSFTPLDATWEMITGFTAELTAATFSFTAQAVARYNDYVNQLTAASFAVTAQAATWLQDTVMTLSASSFAFVARVLAWSDGIPQYIPCIYMPLTRAYKRMWRRLNGDSQPYQ
jgi:hypothetical protein